MAAIFGNICLVGDQKLDISAYVPSIETFRFPQTPTQSGQDCQ
ncbi:hypothetical protein LEP1GSC195_3733 [Leptospira wolbachii serovar Codice str. CDC]|uniref:Uncharacterized protein n=1 Tax=Leptospira wolbachii serovar Codice str. CDC TaxID=1218599 RepID=R9A4K4_9LEPT|nr:hypothetical protein LEP1GSC195_3733 [Leptospira wolbachii serovar Codice str. CDC]